MRTDETHLLTRMGSPVFVQLARLSRPCPAPASPTLPPAAIIRGSIGGSRTLTRPWPLTQFMQNQVRVARANVTALASLAYGTWAPFAYCSTDVVPLGTKDS